MHRETDRAGCARYSGGFDLGGRAGKRNLFLLARVVLDRQRPVVPLLRRKRIRVPRRAGRILRIVHADERVDRNDFLRAGLFEQECVQRSVHAFRRRAVDRKRDVLGRPREVERIVAEPVRAGVRRAAPFDARRDRLSAVCGAVIRFYRFAVVSERLLPDGVDRRDRVFVARDIAVIELRGRGVVHVEILGFPCLDLGKRKALRADRFGLQYVRLRRIGHLAADHAVEIMMHPHVIDQPQRAAVVIKDEIAVIDARTVLGVVERQRRGRARSDAREPHGTARFLQHARRRMRHRNLAVRELRRDRSAADRLAVHGILAGELDGKRVRLSGGQEHAHGLFGLLRRSGCDGDRQQKQTKQQTSQPFHGRVLLSGFLNTLYHSYTKKQTPQGVC